MSAIAETEQILEEQTSLRTTQRQESVPVGSRKWGFTR